MTTTAPGGGYADIPPDDKDWTWVVERECPECGERVADVSVAELPAAVRATVPRWHAALARPDVRERPSPTTWSPLEYGAHVRDVNRVFAARLAAMAAQDGVRFQNWDQDAAARDGGYAEQDPAAVAVEVADSAEHLAALFEAVDLRTESHRGLRSNGSQFTVRTLGQYYLHDVLHHLWDVGA